VESCHPCGEIHHGTGEHNHPHEQVVFSSGLGAAPSVRRRDDVRV
jgi:hypothetical protein